MSVSIRASEDAYMHIKRQAKREQRTLQGQIDFLVRVERAARENPDLPYSMVTDIVASLIDDEQGVPLDPEQLA